MTTVKSQPIKTFSNDIYVTLSSTYLENALYALNMIQRLARGDLFAIDELFLDQRFLIRDTTSTKAPSLDYPIAYSVWEYSSTKSLLLRWKEECLLSVDKTPSTRIDALESAISKFQDSLINRKKPTQIYLDNWNVLTPSVFLFQKNVEGDYSWTNSMTSPLRFETKTQTDIIANIPALPIKKGHEICLTVDESYAVQSALECYFRLLIGQWKHLENIQYFTNVSWGWDYNEYDLVEQLFKSEICKSKTLAGVRSDACQHVHLMYDYLRYVLTHNQTTRFSKMNVGGDEPSWSELNKHMRCQAGTIEELFESLLPNQGLGMIKSTNIYGHNTVNTQDLHTKPIGTTTGYIMSKCLYQVRDSNTPQPQENSMSIGF